MADGLVARQAFATDLIQLGFKPLDEYKYLGRVPNIDMLNDIYIEVEIEFKGYPLEKPRIDLVSIKGNDEIFRCVPSKWRHLDESIGETPAKSRFSICCMHNWSANDNYNATFVYKRILAWLEANTTEIWPEDEDLPTWRILPTFVSDIRLYISQKFIDKIAELKANFEGQIRHTPYKMKGAGEVNAKNPGNKYSFDDIAFTFKGDETNFYKYVAVSEFDGKEISLIGERIFEGKSQCSASLILYIDSTKPFKSIFQLFETLKHQMYQMKDFLNKRHKNAPIIFVYQGDKGRNEIVALLVDLLSLQGKTEDIKYRSLQIETVVQREIAIKQRIALLGAGALGSQIAKLLVDKGVAELAISDFDFLSTSNLGFNELSAHSLGGIKSIHLASCLKARCSHYDVNVYPEYDDLKAATGADIIVVVVGNSRSFDKLAFRDIKDIAKPIVWAWVSENNILQEIVITGKTSGCLNCYYELTKSNDELARIHSLAKNEIERYPRQQVDGCGNPHTVSQWERMVFLASQIVTLLAFYSRNNRFPFEYVNYLWPMEDVFPAIKTGYVNASSTCFCRRT